MKSIFVQRYLGILCLFIGSIAIGMLVWIDSASASSIQVTLLDAKTTKEPQPFVRTVEFLPGSTSMGSSIALAGLQDNEVWLIITLQVKSSEKVKLKNKSDVVFVGLTSAPVTGYLEEKVYSFLDPSRKNYSIVWDSLDSEQTISPGTSTLKVVFQVPDKSVLQGLIKILNMDSIQIDKFPVEKK